MIGAKGIGWFDVEAGAILRELADWPLLFENNANLVALALDHFFNRFDHNSGDSVPNRVAIEIYV